MTYHELRIEMNRPGNQADIITALLEHHGFESFQTEDFTWKGYIQDSIEKDWQRIITEELPGGLYNSWEVVPLEDKNWNDLWEKDYSIIQLSKGWEICAPFHDQKNISGTKSVIIEPQMSFGTGHHPTTLMMCNYLISDSPIDQNVLDMGAGTGILSILAEKLGAKNITAIDNEERAFDNIKNNIQLNNNQFVTPICSDTLPDVNEKYDLILANINKNILFELAEKFHSTLKKNAKLVLSGFFDIDCAEVGTHFERYNLPIVDTYTEDGWAVCIAKKR